MITRNGKRRKGGFTLLELIVVIFLIILMASIVLPSLGRLIEFNQEAQAYNLVACMITLARNEAMRTSTYTVMHGQPCNGFSEKPKLATMASMTTVNVPPFYMNNHLHDSDESFTFPDLLDRQGLCIGTVSQSLDWSAPQQSSYVWSEPQFNNAYNHYSLQYVFAHKADGSSDVPIEVNWGGTPTPGGGYWAGGERQISVRAGGTFFVGVPCANHFASSSNYFPYIMPGTYAVGEISDTFVDGSGNYITSRFDIGDHDSEDIRGRPVSYSGPPNDGMDDGITDFMTTNVLFTPQGQLISRLPAVQDYRPYHTSDNSWQVIRPPYGSGYTWNGYYGPLRNIGGGLNSGDPTPYNSTGDDPLFYGHKALFDRHKWARCWTLYTDQDGRATDRSIWDESRGKYGAWGLTLFDSSKLRAIQAGNGKTAAENRADYLNKNGQIIPVNRYNGLLFPRK